MKALLALVLLGAANAQGPFAAADDAYRAGRYADAVELLEAAQPGDEARGAWCYRLGSCAYRLDRFADAVWHYRRALSYLPGEPHVTHDLRLAEHRLGIEQAPPAAVERGLAALGRVDPALRLVLSAALQAAGLGAWLLSRAIAARAAAALAIALGVAAAAHLAAEQRAPAAREAVVLLDRVVVRAEPHASTAIRAELRAGQTVRVAEASDRWARVDLPGATGWIETAGVGFVD